MTQAAPKPESFLISYSRKNRGFAVHLQNALAAKGHDVRRDESDLHPAKNFEDEIRRNLEDVTSLVVLLSPTSVKSDYVKGEANLAFNTGKTVIPVLHKACNYNNMPLRLLGETIIDIRYRFEAGLTEILERVPQPTAWWVYILRVTGIPIPVTLLALGIAFLIYWSLPSRTTAELIDRRDPSAIYVLLRNRRLKSSALVAPCSLAFGELPVVDTILDRADRSGNIVPPLGSKTIALKKTAGFEPRLLPDGSFKNAEEIGALTPQYELTLDLGVRESDGTLAPPIRFPAASIREFLETQLPTTRFSKVKP